VERADVEFETRSLPNLLVATLATLPFMSLIPSATFAHDRELTPAHPSARSQALRRSKRLALKAHSCVTLTTSWQLMMSSTSTIRYYQPDRVIVHRLRRLTQIFLHSWFRDSTCGFESVRIGTKGICGQKQVRFGWQPVPQFSAVTSAFDDVS
jgi:hypothetical protein